MTILSDELLQSLRPDAAVPHGRKWAEPRGAIGAGIAESDFGTAPFLKARLARAIQEDLLTYLPDDLADAAASSCAELYRTRFGWDVPDTWVRATPDVLSALLVALEVFPQDTPVFVPTPCYSPFFAVPQSMGREVIEVPMPRGFDLERLRAASPAPGSVLLLCNPHNPTGQVLTTEQLVELASFAEEADLFLFVDEIHAPLVYSPGTHVPFGSVSDAAAHRSITAISPSKGWNIPGLKTAHVVIPNEGLRKHWDRLDRHPVRSGSPLGALGVASAYSPEGLLWLEQLVTRFEANRNLVEQCVRETLPLADMRAPEATYLAWIGFERYDLAEDPSAHFLQRAGVSTVPGRSCGSGFEHFIRFNFATPPETIHAAMRAIAGAVTGAPTR